MTTRTIFIAIAAAFTLGAVAARPADAQSPTTVIIVRHAEKAATPANDPPLTDVGIARAKALAAEHAKAVADAVRRHAGETVLVVGHSNTVMRIVEALGGPKLPDLCDSEYSGLFTLVLDGPMARLVVGSYGAPSPAVPTGCTNPMK